MGVVEDAPGQRISFSTNGLAIGDHTIHEPA